MNAEMANLMMTKATVEDNLATLERNIRVLETRHKRSLKSALDHMKLLAAYHKLLLENIQLRMKGMQNENQETDRGRT